MRYGYRAGLALAWGLSFASLALDLTPSAPIVPGASRFGLVLLPWLFVAGLPCRGEQGDATSVVLHGLALLGWLAPPAALALALDVTANRLDLDGAGAVRVALGLALVALWSCARVLALRSERAWRLHGWCWLVLVPGLAAAEVALGWAPLTGGASGAAAWPTHVGALPWSFAWTVAEAPRDVPSGALAIGVAVAALGLVAARASRGELAR